MKERPLVCICVPTYNAAATVREMLMSVLAQTYPNFVVHVSDNASTDDTIKVIEALADPRIIVHRNETNIGGEGNFNRCIELAEGKYTAIFHADDLYEPEMVEKQVAFLDAHSDAGAVFTQATTIDAQGKALGRIGQSPDGQTGVAYFDFRHLLQTLLLHHNFLVCPSVLVRTKIYQQHIVAWGSAAYRSSSDIDTWLRLAQYQPIALLDEPLMRYRISPAQFSERIRSRTERTDFFLVMDDYLSRPAVRALLDEADLRHYQWLLRHENVACGMNLFAAERFAEARQRLRDTLNWDAVHAARHTRRGKVTLAAALLLRLLWGSPSTARVVKILKNLVWR